MVSTQFVLLRLILSIRVDQLSGSLLVLSPAYMICSCDPHLFSPELGYNHEYVSMSSIGEVSYTITDAGTREYFFPAVPAMRQSVSVQYTTTGRCAKNRKRNGGTQWNGRTSGGTGQGEKQTTNTHTQSLTSWQCSIRQ